MRNISKNIGKSYYPFGGVMPGRSYVAENEGVYRFGFNGKEKDIEGMGGGGSTYDYGFRIYNPQIGRFLSVDPLTKSYPMLSTYQFASNTPIWAIDLDGLEAAIQSFVMGINANGEEFVISSSFSTIDDKTYEPDPKYGDKGILTIYTNVDNAEKSREVYSEIHVEVEPTKLQKIKKSLNDFDYKEDIEYPVQEGVQNTLSWAVIEIYPLGRALNAGGIIEPNQTKDVVTGEPLGNTTNKAVGFATNFSQFFTGWSNVGYNVAESVLNRWSLSEENSVTSKVVLNGINTAQGIFTTKKDPVKAIQSVVNAVSNSASSLNTVSISLNNKEDTSTSESDYDK